MASYKRLVALLLVLMMAQVACQGFIPVKTPGGGCGLVGVVGKPGGIGIGIPIGQKQVPGQKKKAIAGTVEPTGWAEVSTRSDTEMGYAVMVADLSSPVTGAEFIIEGTDEVLAIPADAIAQNDGTVVISGTLDYDPSDLISLQDGDWTLVIRTEKYPDGEVQERLAE